MSRKKNKCDYCAFHNECDDESASPSESVSCLRGECFTPADKNKPGPVNEKQRTTGQRYYYDMGNDKKPTDKMLKDMQYERDNWT